ncbi:MAG: hypothetical protein AMXMBFR59_42450 [Rhodanobacteraceae bacterium]
MFSVRINDIFFIKGRGMVLTGRVEKGKVCVGARASLRTPLTAVPTTLVGVERNRKLVSCVSAGEDVALMVREIDPSQLTGGIELVESVEKHISLWRVLDLVVEETQKHWWDIWK